VGLRRDQWREYYREAFRIIKPGGFIQSCEIDFFEFQDEFCIGRDYIHKLGKCHASKDLFNFSDGVVAQYKPIMESAGFVDIRIYRKSFDHGDWRSGIGHFKFSALSTFSEPDPSRATASQACPEAFPVSTFTYIAETLFEEYIPDPTERRAYGERVAESVGSGGLTYNVYFLSICHL
jgi:hypothetical protein